MSKVLLIGMGTTALSALQSLVQKFDVLGVVRNITKEDTFSDHVTNYAQLLGIPIFSDISQHSVSTVISNLCPDCVVISSYNRLLSRETLARCPFINVHYALLPMYRGRANVNWAIINDEPFTGITIHRVVPGLDAGNILFQERVFIHDSDVTDLYTVLNAIQRRKLAEVVGRTLEGYEGIPQNDAAATYGCSRVPADGEIDWTLPTRSIFCLIRALASPFPGAYTYFEGKRLFIRKARILENPRRYDGRVEGRVVAVSKSNGYADVLTGDGVLRILAVQFEGHEPVTAAEVLQSVRQSLGLRVSDLLERIAILEHRMSELSNCNC